MKRKKIKFICTAVLGAALLFVNTGLNAAASALQEPVSQICVEEPVSAVEEASIQATEIQTDAVWEAQEDHGPAADIQTGQEIQTDECLEADMAAGDNVYPARTAGSYTIQAVYQGGSRSGQYDKYTISIADVDKKVNMSTRRNVQATAVYSGNASGSLISEMSHTAGTTHAGLYADQGSSTFRTTYNYLYSNFRLTIPTGYRIDSVQYTGQGSRGTLHHLYLDNADMGFNTESKTWNSSKAQLLTPAHASTGAASSIAVKSMVDIFYHAGIGTTSATYGNAHGKVTQSVTMVPVTYTLSYNANGGSGAPEAQSMTYDTPASLSAVQPQCTGYRFTGWSIGGADYRAGQDLSAVQVSSFAAVQGAVVSASAQWEPITYTVLYDLDGGSGSASAQEAVYGRGFTLASAPVKEGYTFGGWQQTGSDSLYAAGQKIQAASLCSVQGETVTMKARWTAGGYQIRFDTGAGDETAQVISYCIDENAVLPQAPERKGYVFTGWKINGAVYSAGESIKNLSMTNGDILSATAQWQPICYNIAYDGNGATQGVTANQDALLYDTDYRLQPNGYQKQYTIAYDLQGGVLDHPIEHVEAEFVGWRRIAEPAEASGTDEPETDLILENNAVVSNLTAKSETVVLYAEWDDGPLTIPMPLPVKSADVEPAADGSGKKGYKVTRYRFAGWLKNDGRERLTGDTITIGEDTVLRAEWSAQTSFSEQIPSDLQTAQILNKLSELEGRLSNGYNLTDEQAQQVLDAIEKGSAFVLPVGDAKYTIIRNEDGTLTIKLATMPEDVKKISIPSEVKIGGHSYSITEIYKECFRNNTNLKEVSVGNHISRIGDGAFAGCTQLEKITLSEGLTVIGSRAFDGCSALKKVKLPATLQTIGSYAFRNCTSLGSVTYNDGLLAIGAYAFYRCRSLSKAALPDTVIKIGKYAFAECGKLKTAGMSKACTVMGEGVFANCASLTKIVLKQALTGIPAKAFMNCRKLTGVKMDNKVTTIGRSAFSGCRSLKSVRLSASLITIGQQAFMDCRKLSGITIPEKVITVKSKAFYRCSALKKVKLQTVHLTSVGRDAFKSCKKGLRFTVPTDKKQAYIKLLKGKY